MYILCFISFAILFPLSLIFDYDVKKEAKEDPMVYVGLGIFYHYIMMTPYAILIMGLFFYFC